NETGKEHPLLRVLFDLRRYRDGQKRLDVTVENTLDVPGATAVTYDVTLSAAGKTLFERKGLRHHYLTRWRKVFGLGLKQAQTTVDFEPFYQANALPRYLRTLPNKKYSTAGPTFDLLKRGGLAYDHMNNAGGRPELAPYPDWAAEFLVHQSASQREHLLANGDLAGSQPMHLREADGALVSIDRRPQFWLDARGKGGVPGGAQPRGDLSERALGPLHPDMAHQPSLAFIPYLLTGDRYYADEMRFWANFNLLVAAPPGREKDRGLLYGAFAPVGTYRR